jgi:hypothetical protein
MPNAVAIRSVALCALFAAIAQAGPVTTVPWNGFTGAASFTYDDARSSQLPNLIPQLDGMGVKATFFMTYGAGGDLSTRKADWIKAAKNGHELANHTYDHQNVTAGNTQVAKMAADLRSMDPVIEAVTFAYPNCAVGGESVVSSEAFIGRGCGGASYAWGTQPSNWMNIQGLILSNNNIQPAVTALNSAKSANTWVSMIVHDVKDNPDQYSLTAANNKTMVQQAVTNKMWIATYQEVAAYYRAHFTMDAATATTTSKGWNLKWTSPHAKMPKKVMLRVKLDSKVFGDSVVVSQGDAVLARQSDGSYLVDFMKLSMDVAKKGAVGVRGARTRASDRFSVRREATGIVVEHAKGESFLLTVRTASGKVVAWRSFTSSEAGTARIDLDPSLASVALFAVVDPEDGQGRLSVPLAP